MLLISELFVENGGIGIVLIDGELGVILKANPEWLLKSVTIEMVANC